MLYSVKKKKSKTESTKECREKGKKKQTWILSTGYHTVQFESTILSLETFVILPENLDKLPGITRSVLTSIKQKYLPHRVNLVDDIK